MHSLPQPMPLLGFSVENNCASTLIVSSFHVVVCRRSKTCSIHLPTSAAASQWMLVTASSVVSCGCSQLCSLTHSAVSWWTLLLYMHCPHKISAVTCSSLWRSWSTSLPRSSHKCLFVFALIVCEKRPGLLVHT